MDWLQVLKCQWIYFNHQQEFKHQFIFLKLEKHDFQHNIIKLIDFRNDGYTRTKRGIAEIDHPTGRYQDILIIYKMGMNANKTPISMRIYEIWRIYIEDVIYKSGMTGTLKNIKR
jgi:hypothetical protein